MIPELQKVPLETLKRPLVFLEMTYGAKKISPSAWDISRIFGWYQHPSFGLFLNALTQWTTSNMAGIHFRRGPKWDTSWKKYHRRRGNHKYCFGKWAKGEKKISPSVCAISRDFRLVQKPQLRAFFLSVLHNGPPAIWRDIHFMRGPKWYKRYKKYHWLRWNLK